MLSYEIQTSNNFANETLNFKKISEYSCLNTTAPQITQRKNESESTEKNTTTSPYK